MLWFHQGLTDLGIVYVPAQPTLCDTMNCSLQSPLSIGFFSQGYWSGLPFPLSEDLLDPGIEPVSPLRWQVDS